MVRIQDPKESSSIFPSYHSLVLTRSDTPGQIRSPVHTAKFMQSPPSGTLSPPRCFLSAAPTWDSFWHSAQCFRLLEAQVIKGYLSQKIPGVDYVVTIECCPLKYTTLGVGQSRRHRFRKSKDKVEVGLLTRPIPSTPNTELIQLQIQLWTCPHSLRVCAHLLSTRHCEHTSEQSGDLPSWSPAYELVNSLTSHVAPRLDIPAPSLAPPSACLAFLLTFVLLLTVIQFLHLNPPLPHPCPTLSPSLLLGQAQCPSPPGTRVCFSLPIHLPTLEPIFFLEGKSDRDLTPADTFQNSPIIPINSWAWHSKPFAMQLWPVSSFNAHTTIQAHQLLSTAPQSQPTFHIYLCLSLSAAQTTTSRGEVPPILQSLAQVHLLQGAPQWLSGESHHHHLCAAKFFVPICRACMTLVRVCPYM